MKKLIALVIFSAAAAIAAPVAELYGGPANWATQNHNGQDDDDDGKGEGAICSSDAACNDNNVCTKDKCKHGRCDYKDTHKDKQCDDGNACTGGDKCDDGVCKGKKKSNGTACSDGNACTQLDTCQTGVCTGANPVVCSASDQCHVAGACDPASGVCSDPAAPDGVACVDIVTCSGQDTCQAGVCSVPGALVQKIAYVSSRDNPTGTPPTNFAEIYLLNPDDPSNRVRLTENADGDVFPALSPDGKGRIAFDSNRNRASGDPLNLSDLFLMQSDGTNPQYLVRGSSATWSADSQRIAFHRSASGTGLPINTQPGAPAADSDIFVARVCDLRAGVAPTNITNSPTKIDVDADWSNDGQKIVFSSSNVGDNPLTPTSSEIWVMNPDGSGVAQQLTINLEEERAPAWSPDGTRITYMCRKGGSDFEICVMNADGTGQTQLTFNTVNDATPSYSPDGTKIVFQRAFPPTGQQLMTMNPDGTSQTQLTDVPGINIFANWGFIRE